jgi:hypothetical protein
MLGLDPRDTNNFLGSIMGIILGVTGFIFSRAIAVMNLKPYASPNKEKDEKMIKILTIYGKVFCFVIIMLAIYEILTLLKKVMH